MMLSSGFLQTYFSKLFIVTINTQHNLLIKEKEFLWVGVLEVQSMLG